MSDASVFLRSVDEPITRELESNMSGRIACVNNGSVTHLYDMDASSMALSALPSTLSVGLDMVFGLEGVSKKRRLGLAPETVTLWSLHLASTLLNIRIVAIAVLVFQSLLG